MKPVRAEVFLVARPDIDYDGVAAYLRQVGGERWLERLDRDQIEGDQDRHDAENLVEFAGKMCYRSWEPGLNPNVRRVRDDHAKYLENILRSGHGSVLEHASFTFVLHNVSRVATHELVRHRPGRPSPRSRCASCGSTRSRSGSPTGRARTPSSWSAPPPCWRRWRPSRAG